MTDNTQPHHSGCNQADHLREKYCHGKTDQQSRQTGAQILRQQHAKQPGPAHSHHQIHTKFMPAPFQLKFAGIINQEKQNTQRQSVKCRNHKQQLVNRIALHLFQEKHHVLMGQG